MKRQFVISIIVLLLLGFSADVYAVLAGSGTVLDPYLIQSLTDFDQFTDPANSATYWANGVYTELMCDIDLTGRTYTAAVIAPDTNSTTSGFQGVKFEGVFNGNSHKVDNLTIGIAGTDFYAYLGLFGTVSSTTAEIKNLNMENASISGPDNISHVGTLCGENKYATIANCSIAVTMTTGEYSSHIGGICGTNIGTVNNCRAVVNINMGISSSGIGGICGYNFQSDVNSCTAEGLITIRDKYPRDEDNYYDIEKAGGIVGWTDSGSLTNCRAFVDINAYNYIGGICGDNNYGVIINCYATGNTFGHSSVGGLCGNNYGNLYRCYATGQSVGGLYDNAANIGGLCGINRNTISNCYATGSASAYGGSTNGVGGLCGTNSYGTVSNCYSTGAVSGDNYVGGFCGFNYAGNVNNCFWDTQTSGMPSSSGGTGATTTQMQLKATYTGASWDFVGETANGTDDYWKICETTNYPKLSWQSIPGDFLCPYGVDFLDFAVLAQAWFTAPGDANYNPTCDLNNDNIIDYGDLAILIQSWQTGL